MLDNLYQQSCIVVSIPSLALLTLSTGLQFADNKQTGLWMCGPITKTNITISIYTKQNFQQDNLGELH